MAKRFHATIETDKQITYDIEIYDDSFGGASTEFRVASPGFLLKYEGNSTGVYQPINASAVTIPMVIENTTHQAIIADLRGAAEKRFKVIINRSSSLYWAGLVVPDNSQDQDLPFNYVFNIEATDGLGMLRDIDYNNAGTAYTGEATLLEHIHNCLSKTNLLNFAWTAGINTIETVDNWYENSHATTAADDPLALTRVKHRAFYDVDNKGVKTFRSCYDVLMYILQSRHARLMLSAGLWRITQVPELADATMVARYYDRDGAYLTNNATLDFTRTFNQDSATGAKSGGQNVFNAYPALNKVEITYRAKSWQNLFEGASWQGNVVNTVTLGEVNFNSNSTTIRFQAKVTRSLQNNSYTANVGVAQIWRVRIKIGNYYLRRNLLSVNNYSVSYDTVGWTAGENWYYFHDSVINNIIPSVGSSHPIGSILLDAVSPVLIETGSPEVTLEYAGARRLDNGTGVSQDDLALTWSTSETGFYVFSNNDPILDSSDEFYEATNDATGNTQKLAFETIIGDGPTVNSQGRLQVNDGAAWSDASSWLVGGAGTSYNIMSLVALSILAGQKTPTRRFIGQFYGVMYAHERIDDNDSGSVWVLTQATYNAQSETWDGEFYEIADSPADITVADPVSVDPGLPNFGPYDPSNTTGGVGPGPGLPNTGQPGPPVPPGTQDPGPVVTGIGGILGDTKTNILIPQGNVTTISTTQTLNNNAFTTGQVITVVNPITGYTKNFTVTQNSAAGDTTINVSGYSPVDFPVGSFIMSSPQNQTVQGYSSGSSSGGQSTQSSWWEIYGQWWSEDDTNDIDWPIEAVNVAIETDENAGDGATAGIRIDGDGVQVYNSSSSTARASLLATGGWDLRTVSWSTTGLNIASGAGIIMNVSSSQVLGITHTGRFELGWPSLPSIYANGFVVLESNGVIHNDIDGTGTDWQPNYGHIRKFRLFGFRETWSTGIQDEFWGITGEYAGYEVWKVSACLGDSYGATGTNDVDVKIYDDSASASFVLASFSLDSTTPSNTLSVGSPVSFAQDDKIFFDVTATSTTPAQGLYIELYLRKT